MIPSSEVRQQFIDFFCNKHGHTFVPSSSVVPTDDATLLFTNAGMNQFKPIFLGTETRPYKRAANTQKCIRAGGKHNDLDDVGKDTYHHTFFEMLGNWSFGDYFKREAIRWAWELLTDVWKLDKTRLHATVFEGGDGVERDDEAFELWKSETDVDPSHIHWGNKKDNFWEMGDTGPCGPCSEIHIDKTPDKSGGHLVNKGREDVIEIWNLVFIQFNRNPDKSLTPLPAKHVDTGMGFERVTAVIQGKKSNYDTDIFTPLFAAIQKVTGAPPYSGKMDDHRDVAYRVIADHLRCLTFALTDGAAISNVGRGYVLRRILRRAERYGRQYLGAKQPFLVDLVPAVVETMSGAFPELKRSPGKVQSVIEDEEKSFIRTLDRGIHLFAEAAERAKQQGNRISGEDAFKLHDTYGLYVDITEQMAHEAGLTVDRPDYDSIIQKRKAKDKEGRKRMVVTAVQGDVPKTDDSPKYAALTCPAHVVGWVKASTVVREGKLEEGEEVGLLLDRTNFYAEQGGQIGDSGVIRTATGEFEVDETQKLGDAVLHLGRVSGGTLEAGQSANLEVGGDRPHTMRNHTATHLMNWALREVLGPDVEQKGSLVDREKTRFDFTHDKPLTHEEIAHVEQLVNERIYADLPVTPLTMPLAEAKKLPGVRAVFGEKYPDPVRVLIIGANNLEEVTPQHSVEFCGGTHLTHTGQAGFFKIVSQEGVAKGVRRVTAVTGKGAVEAVQKLAGVVDSLTSTLGCKPDEVPARVQGLLDEAKKLQAQVKKGAAADLNSAGDALLASASDVGGVKLVVGEVPAAPVEQMRTQIDRLKQKAGSVVVLLGWVDEGKVVLMSAITPDLEKRGLHAGNLLKDAAKSIGGTGGGKPLGIAQGGGGDPAKLAVAFETAKKLATEKLA